MIRKAFLKIWKCRLVRDLGCSLNPLGCYQGNRFNFFSSGLSFIDKKKKKIVSKFTGNFNSR